MIPFNYQPDHVIGQETLISYIAFDNDQNSITCSFSVRIRGKFKLIKIMIENNTVDSLFYEST